MKAAYEHIMAGADGKKKAKSAKSLATANEATNANTSERNVLTSLFKNSLASV